MAKRQRTRTRGNGQGSLYKRSAGGVWIAAYYDASGRRKAESTGTTDKAAAKRILGKLVADAAERRRGVIDARSDAIAAANQRGLAKHIADFRQSIIDEGRTAKHADTQHELVTRVCELGRIETLPDILPDRVQTAIGKLREGGRSVRTLNKARGAIKQFSLACRDASHTRRHARGH